MAPGQSRFQLRERWGREAMWRYLLAYIERFRLEERIELRSKVISIERSADLLRYGNRTIPLITRTPPCGGQGSSIHDCA